MAKSCGEGRSCIIPSRPGPAQHLLYPEARQAGVQRLGTRENQRLPLLLLTFVRAYHCNPHTPGGSVRPQG